MLTRKLIKLIITRSISDVTRVIHQSIETPTPGQSGEFQQLSALKHRLFSRPQGQVDCEKPCIGGHQ